MARRDDDLVRGTGNDAADARDCLQNILDMDLTEEVRNLTDAITVGQHHITLQYRSLAALFTPNFLPTRGNRPFQKAGEKLNNTIYDMIRERRGSEEQSNDLLSMLVHARDDAGGTMSDQQVRDEAMTLFLAGHDTTANALSWTWYLLSQYPEVESRLLAELENVLEDECLLSPMSRSLFILE